MNYKSCWLTVNRACNLRCSWCYARGTEYKKEDDMPLELAYQIIDLCNDLNIKHITLIGGEPTIYPYLQNVLTYANTKNIQCGIATNGLMYANIEFLKKLIELGIKHFGISLKGENRQVYNQITGVDGFNTVVTGINNCIKLGLKPTISMVLTEDNINSFVEGVEYFHKIGVKNFRFSFCYDFDMNSIGTKHHKQTNPKYLVHCFMKNYDYLNEITMGKFVLFLSLPLCLWEETFIEKLVNRHQITTICQLLNRSGLIFDNEGNLLPCNAMTDLKLGKLNIDFSNADELIEYTKKENFKHIYDRLCGLPDSECLNCKKLKYCGGGCVCQWTNYSYKQLKNLEDIK